MNRNGVLYSVSAGTASSPLAEDTPSQLVQLNESNGPVLCEKVWVGAAAEEITSTPC